MIGVLISLAVTLLVVWILLKKMKAQFVLVFGGFVLLAQFQNAEFGRPQAPAGNGAQS